MTKYIASKYSFENPDVWVPAKEEEAKKDIPFLIEIFNKYGKVKSVLDVGCGYGVHDYLLSKKGYECMGIEPHPKMIEFAEKNYPSVKFDVKSMQEAYYPNNFDAILCIGSIIVFNKSNEEAFQTFNNFYKTLKKGGILVVETFNAISWITNKSFRGDFEEINKEKNEKEVYHEYINSNNQSYVSERTYFDLSTGKKKGEFTKESRMFFPLELKFFLEQAGFKVKTILSSEGLSNMNFKDTNLNKRRLLVIAKKE